MGVRAAVSVQSTPSHDDHVAGLCDSIHSNHKADAQRAVERVKLICPLWLMSHHDNDESGDAGVGAMLQRRDHGTGGAPA